VNIVLSKVGNLNDVLDSSIVYISAANPFNSASCVLRTVHLQNHSREFIFSQDYHSRIILVTCLFLRSDILPVTA